MLFIAQGLSEYDYALFVNDLLIWLGCHFQPVLTDTVRLLLILEETHLLTSIDRLRRAGLSDPSVLKAARMFRNHVLALVCADQIPSLLPRQILGNASTRIVFQTINGFDLHTLQDSRALDF